MTGALDAQPETTAITTTEVIERTQRIRIGERVGSETGGSDLRTRGGRRLLRDSARHSN
jgi:hypothetical protein